VFVRQSSDPSPGVRQADDPSTTSHAPGEHGLADLLRPTPIAAVQARVLPTRRFLLPKGSFIDCTLETAIDSTLPGMTTCVVATDTFSADGSVVLLERGTRLVGETRGQVQQGTARIFVLWTEARTPTGVVVPLDSPGTDELGRSGLTGTVDRHFWERFGAAILITAIEGAVQAAVQPSAGSGGTVIYNPSASQEVLTEVLKGTLNIPPTVRKSQGDRIEILVARDVDFRSVYELRR
jgi:type IV secretion system protein VirB10